MSHSVFRLSLAAAAGAALVVVGLPTASAAPETDGRGYVDSTASCPSPSVVVEFGSTDSSRVAICTNDGEYQYRGVRVRDGAKVILDAEKTDSGAFVAENDGIMVIRRTDATGTPALFSREAIWHSGGG